MTGSGIAAAPSSPRLWTPADDPERFLQLVRLVLGPRPLARRTPEFWRWKHVENPFGPSLGLYHTGAEDSADPIGLRMLVRWAFDDGRIPAARAVDTATHPDHRRRGVFSSLTRAAVERLAADGVRLIFNTPNPVSLAGYRRLGWRVVARWPRYFRLLRPIAYLRRRLGLRLPPRPGRDAWEACFGPDVRPWDGFVAAEAGRLADLVARCEATRPRRVYRTPRTWPYLTWRYGGLAELHRAAGAGEPYLRYGVVPLEGDGRLRAAAIVRPTLSAGLAAVSLVEMFVERPDVELGRALLSRVLSSLAADHVVAHFARGSVERAALAAAGFHRLPGQSTTFAARPLGPGPDPLAAGGWDLSLGDLEVF